MTRVDMFERYPADPLRLAVMVMLAAASVIAMIGELGRVLPPHGLWDFGAFVASGRAAAEGLDPYGIYPLTPMWSCRASSPGTRT
ncbi:hypothetical protein ACFSYD_17730 [Paracoccus aerius]